MPLRIYSLELKPDSAILPSIGVNPAILNSIILQVDLILRLLNIHLTFLATTNSQKTIKMRKRVMALQQYQSVVADFEDVMIR